MGQLIEGVWSERQRRPTNDGRFVRAETQFRNWITADGSAGPTGAGGFAAAAGRYHLYVSLACPWAHRTLIMRRLKGLEDAIGVSVVHWHLGANGWEFREGRGATGDRLHGCRYLHEIYTRAKPDYTGRVTVPVLWDRERETIVNNEFRRDHPDAQLGLRRGRRPRRPTSIPSGCARRSTRSTTGSTRRSTTASIAPASPRRRRPTRRR